MIVRHDMVTLFVVRPDAVGQSHEFLQMHRAPDDYMGSTWQIVRGGVEAGESYIQAVLREMKEETGLRPTELYRLGTVESFYTEMGDTIWHAVPFCAFVSRSAEVVMNGEHVAFRWVCRKEIDSYCMWASERQLLVGLVRDLLDDGIAKSLLRVAI